MKLNQIIHTPSSRYFTYSNIAKDSLRIIREECSDYLTECHIPLFKTLDKTDKFVKIKARMRNYNDGFSQLFNESFDFTNIRQRAVFSNTTKSTDNDYWIFIPNEYHYVYNPMVESHSSYISLADKLSDNTITSLISENYINHSINDINQKCEILFYNISHFYAIKCDNYEYDQIVSDIFNV